MKLRVVFFLLVACVSVASLSCRRNLPSLIDSNRPPETELWYAPLDSSEYEWNVHLYWRGIDFDGTVQGYIWTITDTIEANPALRWNPAERIADLAKGTITTRTDEVISFTAYKNVAGVGLKKNRQAFHIAAIDNNGVIDPTPATIEFVATVAQLPEMRFQTTITTKEPGDGFVTRTRPYNPVLLDTLGMYRPFSLSYHGFTTNGVVTGYKYYPLTTGIVVPGQDTWYTAVPPPPDEPDTVRYFTNRGTDVLPSGVFRFVAQCRDESGAESLADVKNYTSGVVQIVVNYEPDTEIFQVEDTYFLNQQKYTELINFKDDYPDTVPYASWVRVDYRGWDNPRDSSLCTENPPPGRELDHCLGYQPGAVQNSQPDIPDSNTKNIGTWDYQLRVRAVDEYGKPDGTMFDPLTGKPRSEVTIIGNLDPTLETANVSNYDGTVASEDADTVVWNWWHPANFPDTLEYDQVEQKNFVKKIYYVEINASGHDHPKEDARFGIVNWRYNVIRTDNLQPEQFFFGQGGWRESASKDVFNERFEIQYRYPADDIGGGSIWANPPVYWNTLYEFSIEGRDVNAGDSFDEILFAGGSRSLINSTIASQSAHRTELRTFRFFLMVKR
jgi:hypothetical protein